VTILGALLAYGTAGFCLFVVVLNRHLLMLPNPGKTQRIATAFVCIVGGSIVLALCLPLQPFIYAPAVVLVAMLVGEVSRAALRYRYRGSKPIGSVVHDIRLTTPVTTTHLACHRFEIPIPRWHGDRLRIVHLSDLHVHAGLPEDYFAATFAAAEGQAPDLVFITGDLISEEDGVDLLRKVLHPIGTMGTYAVLGNHDYWGCPDPVREVIRERGIRLLTNETVQIAVGDRHVALTGCDDPWAPEPWQAQNTGNSLHLVLTHTPDNIYKLSRHSADAVFAGHCHAGQIRLPFVGPIVVPSIYGRRFDHGHFVVRGTHLFVVSGVGAEVPPFRIYCQPDIFVVDVVGCKR